MGQHEREALRLALRMAAVYEAKLTLLHVVPPDDERRSVHWLDAIDDLYGALSRPNRYFSNPASNDPHLAARTDVSTFLASEAPAVLREAVSIAVECRTGDVASEIVRFADDARADLIVLCGEPPQWGLPLWPGLVRSVFHMTRKQIVLVRPCSTSAAPHTGAGTPSA